MRVLIAAAGTGGHIYPGVAVANEIKQRNADAEILFVGTSRGLEAKIVPAAGYQLSLITSAGLKNVGAKGKFKGLAVLPKSFIEAYRLMKEFRPDVVVGAGGYVSGPVLITASFLRIPTLVMESNALPGFTNRRLAKFIDKAALTFEEARPFFGKKGVVTGNPVRHEFFDVRPGERSETLALLVFGGSQGARAINNAVVEALKDLEPIADKLSITHQTGEADFGRISAEYRDSAFPDADVRPYISDMFVEFEKADLIVCRAGATTCAELAAAGKASIMIPLPTAADDHQRRNSEAFEKAGAAKMILQKDLTGKSIAEEIVSLAKAPQKISEMESAARKLAKRDAAGSTVDIIEELASGTKSKSAKAESIHQHV